MERQNTNNQRAQSTQKNFVQQNTAQQKIAQQNAVQQSNSQGQQQKSNNQNARFQPERGKPNFSDKRTRYDKNRERRPNDRNQAAAQNQGSPNQNAENDCHKPHNSKYPQKAREQKGTEWSKENTQNRHKRNFHSSGRGELPSHYIKTARDETVEDIIADTERIEKDIQFEIKQIRAVKLSL